MGKSYEKFIYIPRRQGDKITKSLKRELPETGKMLVDEKVFFDNGYFFLLRYQDKYNSLHPIVSLYDKNNQLINLGKHEDRFFGSWTITDGEDTYTLYVRRTMSKFDWDCFEDEDTTYIAVSKEKHSYKEALKIAHKELEVKKSELDSMDWFAVFRAGVDYNTNNRVTWWLETEYSERSCPVWAFYVK